jgi:hypothetical protein
MTRSNPRLWSLTATIAACGLFLGCDEIEGVYRTVGVRADVSEACIRQALEGVPGATISGESGRWSVRLHGNEDGPLDPSVVLARRNSDTELTVFVSKIVSGATRYSAAELATADKATADVMNALVSACLPLAERISSSCKIQARAVPGGKCQHAGP